MIKADLPIKNASEPAEGAHEPQGTELSAISGTEMPPNVEQNFSKKITFAKTTEYNENASQKSSSYKEILSQPGLELSHHQRLLWLQKRRTSGLWAQCDSCKRWRYLSSVLDRYELPNSWYCWMNADKAYASCSVSEAPLRVRDEEDLIHSEYSTGSVVWARLTGWPWWPAMVDDCPDAEQFYWLDGFSDIPTHYNVVFFDSVEATRAWIAPEALKPYAANKKSFKHLLKNRTYQHRLKAAMAQADDAEKITLPARLAKYSFISRHKGKILSPKKLKYGDLRKYQKRFKNKFNIDMPIESSESDEEIEQKAKDKPAKRNNVIILGTPKRNKKLGKEKRKRAGTANIVELARTEEYNKFMTNNEEAGDSENVVPPNSMVAQAGSTWETAGTDTVDNDTSKTYIPESGINKETSFEHPEFTIRIETPNSDNFDF